MAEEVPTPEEIRAALLGPEGAELAAKDDAALARIRDRFKDVPKVHRKRDGK